MNLKPIDWQDLNYCEKGLVAEMRFFTIAPNVLKMFPCTSKVISKMGDVKLTINVPIKGKKERYYDTASQAKAAAKLILSDFMDDLETIIER